MLNEQLFSVMKMNITPHRSRLPDAHLHSIVRVSTAQNLTPNINELAAETICQTSGSSRHSALSVIEFDRITSTAAHVLTVYTGMLTVPTRASATGSSWRFIFGARGQKAHGHWTLLTHHWNHATLMCSVRSSKSGTLYGYRPCNWCYRVLRGQVLRRCSHSIVNKWETFPLAHEWVCPNRKVRSFPS